MSNNHLQNEKITFLLLKSNAIKKIRHSKMVVYDKFSGKKKASFLYVNASPVHHVLQKLIVQICLLKDVTKW